MNVWRSLHNSFFILIVLSGTIYTGPYERKCRSLMIWTESNFTAFADLDGLSIEELRNKKGLLEAFLYDAETPSPISDKESTRQNQLFNLKNEISELILQIERSSPALSALKPYDMEFLREHVLKTILKKEERNRSYSSPAKFVTDEEEEDLFWKLCEAFGVGKVKFSHLKETELYTQRSLSETISWLNNVISSLRNKAQKDEHWAYINELDDLVVELDADLAERRGHWDTVDRLLTPAIVICVLATGAFAHDRYKRWKKR